jgi:uncharacterized protein
LIEIKHTKVQSKGNFSALDENKVAGGIYYTMAGESRMILDHTEVNNDYRGQGVGKKILLHIVDYARENKIQIIPLCPFAKSVFDKTESIRDVLA